MINTRKSGQGVASVKRDQIVYFQQILFSDRNNWQNKTCYHHSTPTNTTKIKTKRKKNIHTQKHEPAPINCSNCDCEI